MTVDAQPRELTAETAEGQLFDVLPFCISAHSREAHLYLLLFMVSCPQHALRYRTRNHGTRYME